MAGEESDEGGIGTWVLALAVGGSLALTAQTSFVAERRAPVATVEDVKAIVRARFVREQDERALDVAAMRGIAASLDPFSAFLPPEDARAYRDDTDGNLSGIGIEITIEKGYVTVIAPLEDSPAWQAGLLPGDRIIEADGRPLEVSSVEEAARAIKGPAGSKVTLTVVHEGSSRPVELAIERKRISVPSVKRPRLTDEREKIGYVRITQFGPRTDEELRAAVEALLAKGMRALVLDLRSNSGGYLDASLRAADLFVEKGTLLRTEAREAEKSATYEAKAEGTLAPFPLAVLVNGGTASASEVLAGALQDAKRATVVGSRSYGKGCIQSLISLPGDPQGESILKITTARFYTGSGRPIQREVNAKPEDAWGILPDHAVDLEAKRLLEIFRRQDERSAREAAVQGSPDGGAQGSGSTGGSTNGSADGSGSGSVNGSTSGSTSGSAVGDVPRDPQLEKALEVLRAQLAGGTPAGASAGASPAPTGAGPGAGK